LKKIDRVFEFLSLSSPMAVVVDFSAILFVLAITPTAFWDRTPDLCIWHRFILPWIFHEACPISGIFADCHCPGCGLTRAMSAMLHGNFQTAYDYNHLIFIVSGIIIFLIGWNFYKIISAKNNIIK